MFPFADFFPDSFVEEVVDGNEHWNVLFLGVEAFALQGILELLGGRVLPEGIWGFGNGGALTGAFSWRGKRRRRLGVGASSAGHCKG